MGIKKKKKKRSVGQGNEVLPVSEAWAGSTAPHGHQGRTGATPQRVELCFGVSPSLTTEGCGTLRVYTFHVCDPGFSVAPTALMDASVLWVVSLSLSE